MVSLYSSSYEQLTKTIESQCPAIKLSLTVLLVQKFDMSGFINTTTSLYSIIDSALWY